MVRVRSSLLRGPLLALVVEELHTVVHLRVYLYAQDSSPTGSSAMVGDSDRLETARRNCWVKVHQQKNPCGRPPALCPAYEKCMESACNDNSPSAKRRKLKKNRWKGADDCACNHRYTSKARTWELGPACVFPFGKSSETSWWVWKHDSDVENEIMTEVRKCDDGSPIKGVKTPQAKIPTPGDHDQHDGSDENNCFHFDTRQKLLAFQRYENCMAAACDQYTQDQGEKYPEDAECARRMKVMAGIEGGPQHASWYGALNAKYPIRHVTIHGKRFPTAGPAVGNPTCKTKTALKMEAAAPTSRSRGSEEDVDDHVDREEGAITDDEDDGEECEREDSAGSDESDERYEKQPSDAEPEAQLHGVVPENRVLYVAA